MAVDRALMPSLLGGQSMEVPLPPEEPVVVELPDGGVEINLARNLLPLLIMAITLQSSLMIPI